jgi:hypothetical protein
MTSSAGRNSLENPKSRVSVADYVALERLIRERPSLATLEKAVQLFPTCSMFWITYLEFLVENPEKAFKIAERAVAQCSHIELWKRLLNLGKSIYRLPDFIHLYGKAVDTVGNDYQSVDFWLEYTYLMRALFNVQTLNQFGAEGPEALPPNAFLLPLSTNLPPGVTEEMVETECLKLINDRPTVASIRDIFQTALSVPMERIDALWDEYQAFEQVVATAMNTMAQSIPVFPGMPPPPAALASIQATKMLSEYSNRWIQSKQGLREISRLYSAVNLYLAPIPLDTTTVATLQQNIIKWRDIIKHEKGNPLKLNFKRFSSRMNFVLKQCLMVNVYVSEFWYESFIWELFCNGFEAALGVLQTATSEYLTRDCTLRIVLALVYEEMGETDQAFAHLTESISFFSSISNPVPSLFMHFIRFCVRRMGAVRGRSLFLEALREQSIHLSPSLCLAFARLEWMTLQNPRGAREVLDLAANLYPNNIEFQVASAKLGTDLRLAIDHSTSTPTGEPPNVMDHSFADAHGYILQGFMTSLRTDAIDTGDMVELDATEDEEKTIGGVRRPELSRMQPYKPGMDFDEGPVDMAKNKSKSSFPSSLRALLTVLPVCEGHVPDTDTTLRALQVMRLPAIAIASLKRFEEDIHMENLRREKDVVGSAVVQDGENLKRLIGDEKNEDMFIKADLMDDEKDNRDFLSALAANIHRERINYKRHKLSAINAAAVASLGKSRISAI